MNKKEQNSAKNRRFLQEIEKMTLKERQQEILQTLKEKKSADVADLAKALYVSEATVRRDLSEMKSMGLIERSHGRALLPENSDEISIFIRMEKNVTEKEKTATKALMHIPPFKSVYIDSSSTALALAQRIDLAFKTVVTNNLQTALLLAKKSDINLFILGGCVQNNTTCASGSWTTHQLSDFSFDLMISSCATVQGTDAYERSMDQREIKREAFKRCKQHILVVDHTKFTESATYRLNSLREYDLVVTDAPPPEPFDATGINIIW